MRISDWSSDVCSSDLQGGLLRAKGLRQRIAAARLACQFGGNRRCADRDRTGRDLGRVADPAREAFRAEILDLATPDGRNRSEEHTSELQSLMRISYAVFCLKTKKKNIDIHKNKIQLKKTTTQ